MSAPGRRPTGRRRQFLVIDHGIVDHQLHPDRHPLALAGVGAALGRRQLGDLASDGQPPAFGHALGTMGKAHLDLRHVVGNLMVYLAGWRNSR
jgi:hypothetical protein